MINYTPIVDVAKEIGNLFTESEKGDTVVETVVNTVTDSDTWEGTTVGIGALAVSILSAVVGAVWKKMNGIQQRQFNQIPLPQIPPPNPV